MKTNAFNVFRYQLIISGTEMMSPAKFRMSIIAKKKGDFDMKFWISP